ncbi:MAG TPA: S8 family serine peptidase [Actinomycetota bacterium]|nr:S8 family serine peptidase [Actinomycetota bacterium]
MFLLVFSLALLVPPPASPNSPTFSSSRLVDVLVQGDGAAAALAAVGGRTLASLPIVDGLLATIPAGRSPELARRPDVRAVTDADRPLRVRAADPAGGAVDTAGGAVDTAGGAVDAAAPSPGGSATLPVGAPPPAGEGTARLGVGVGVLDTGISSNGDLAGQVVASADLSGEWTFGDSYGHGTFMAGLIAGSGQGGGPAGIAPGADLVDLKVAGADGATTLGQVLAAMQLADAARDRFNLRVLNVSLGAPADDPATAPLTEAAERLWADGITVVAAAGNDGGGVDAPGLDPYVLTVGSVDAAGQVPAWSSRGPDFAGRAKPDLVAPGVGLVGLRAPGSTIDLANPSARVGDRYFRGSGTSMSTAVVAGAAARVLAAHPGWGPDRVKAALTGTADPPGPGSAGSGAGALDLEAALGQVPDRVANGDLFPLRAVGRPGTPPPTPSEPVDGLGWRAGGGDGLRWMPAGGLPGPTAGAGDTGAWTAHPWLSGRWTVDGWSAKSWAAQQWLARVWAARQWSAAGLAPAAWAVLQWSWGGVLAATLDTAGLGGTGLGGLGGTGLGGLGGTVDWAARSWAARSWAERAWGSGDLAARSWAARSWAELAWEARSWAARSWANVDWTARSWASRRWTAGTWAAASWSPPRARATPAARSWARRKP